VRFQRIEIAPCGLGAAAGRRVFNRLFHRFTGLARALLDSANQFFLFANRILEIVIRERGPFLFEFTLGDFPIALHFECGHNSNL